MKKSVVLFIAIIAFILGGLSKHYLGDLVRHYVGGYEGHKHNLQVSDVEMHNQHLNQCIAKALEKHPGAILEVEIEKEDGQWVFDTDVQGKDGKTWDIECDINKAEIVEDSIDKH